MPKRASTKATRALMMWRGITAEALEHFPADFSMRHVAILLSVYLEPEAMSLKSLADRLDISKPAVCRALDALEAGQLLARVRDKRDRRNIFLRRTPKGHRALKKFSEVILRVVKHSS